MGSRTVYNYRSVRIHVFLCRKEVKQRRSTSLVARPVTLAKPTFENTTTLLFAISALAKSMGLLDIMRIPRVRLAGVTDGADWTERATEVEREERDTKANPRTAVKRVKAMIVRANFILIVFCCIRSSVDVVV